jgi:predicted SprT family Zn-dependent metalloprotease
MGSKDQLPNTLTTYSSLMEAYAFFNRALFDNELPPCLITLQRQNGARGYFSYERFANTAEREEITDEIAMNPAHFEGRTTSDILSTLVHEMCHLWQSHCGKRPRSGYHDKQWGAKMQEVGLIPSNTGAEGGKQTGQKVSHYIEKGGQFEQTVQKFLETYPAVLYQDMHDAEKSRKKAESKTKYTCPSCHQNAWAKPNAALVCGTCGEPMQ